MSIFGWSYPPGCSGPPEPADPYPKSEEMCELLESVNVPQVIIDKACAIVDELVAEAERGCLICLERMNEVEQKAREDFLEYEKSHPERI